MNQPPSLEEQLRSYGRVLTTHIDGTPPPADRLDHESPPLPAGNEGGALHHLDRPTSLPARLWFLTAAAAVLIVAVGGAFLLASRTSTVEVAPADVDEPPIQATDVDGEASEIIGPDEGDAAVTDPPETGSAEATGPVGESAVVTVEVFSGRPNPQFSLSEAERANVQELVESATASGSTQPVPGGLGFNGLRVDGLTHEDEPVTFIVTPDLTLVVPIDPDGTEVEGLALGDDGRIYAALKDLGRNSLDREVMELLP